MATTDEELEKLKQKCSAAQMAFTKRANLLTSRVNALGEGELKNEWINFKWDHAKVRDVEFKYASALREVDNNASREKADVIDEKTAECDRKFDDIERTVLKSLWTRFPDE